jgi:hypothetical protein
MVLLSLATFGDTPARGAAPVNDDFASRLPIQLNSTTMRSNAGATVEPEERLTTEDPMGLGCDKQGEAAADGVHSGSTLWWSFTGNGGPITVSTASSGFDTVLAVYETPTGAMLGCNDDIQPLDPNRESLGARVTSELVVNSVAGREYAIQAGSCVGTCAPGENIGQIALGVFATPANDSRAAATPLEAGAALKATNTGATLEPGEIAACGPSLFGKTVWFRYHAPAIGTASFLASGFDTVMTLYRADSPAPLACNDDAISGQNGPSQLPTIDPLGAPITLTPGDYLIQVGGFYETGFPPVGARNGELQVQVQFTEDLDLDNDGINRGADCNDSDPSIRPGAIEVPNNDVDENCDGLIAYDRDHDGFLAPPVGADCDDNNPEVHPFAIEKRGNSIDENCDGKVVKEKPLRITIEARSDRVDKKGDAHTLVRELFVRTLPAGSRIRVHCSKACPFRAPAHPIDQARHKLILATNFRMEVGEELAVLVTKPGWLGREKTFRFPPGRSRVEHEFCVDTRGTRQPCG